MSTDPETAAPIDPLSDVQRRPLGLDPASLKVLVVLEVLFSVAHLALAAGLLFILGMLGDTRAAWAALAVLLALCLAAVERLASGHLRGVAAGQRAGGRLPAARRLPLRQRAGPRLREGG